MMRKAKELDLPIPILDKNLKILCWRVETGSAKKK
jgi:hypothetical protein